jgi:formylglycine-generating enzyme
VKKYLYIILYCLLISTYCLSQDTISQKMVFVKGGKFRMGSKNGDSDEMPEHRVRLNDFYVGKYEVTNAEYAEFLNTQVRDEEELYKFIDLDGKWRDLKCRIYKDSLTYLVEKGYDNYPVSFVSWYGANAYCKWKKGRLPTEAEWEYLAKTPYFKDKNKKKSIQIITEIAVYQDNSGGNLSITGSKMPNLLGILDLLGNVAEWCDDWYDMHAYKNSKFKNPSGQLKGDFKVLRGGSWNSTIEELRISNRNGARPENKSISIGFRLIIPAD